MVKGIELFREYFRDFKEQYVLIGGTACDLLFTEAGLDFRATRDIDLVLIVEALTPEFGSHFWSFIEEGGYQNRNRSEGTPQYYRFDKPENREYPSMIELFSRTESILENLGAHIMPVHIDDDVSSLSAILLNADYYQILLEGKAEISEIMVLKPEYLIVFKVKAYLDIKERLGQESSEAQKHLRDIIRLSTLLVGSERPSMPDTVKGDIAKFVAEYEQAPYDPKQLKLPITVERFLQIMRDVFLSE